MSQTSDCVINEGATSLMLMGTTFVFLQTPGIGLAQAGLVRRKNALSLLMQCLAGLVIGSLLWFTFGYSLTFGPSQYGLIGNLDYAFLRTITYDKCYGDQEIPHLAYVAFQMMFALMVPVIITGAWAEKMTFRSFLVFIILWPIFVYYPLAHWVWNPDGWLNEFGTLDFAGGVTIHTSSGVSALVVAHILQRRKDYSSLGEARHNLPLTVVGGSLIWGGWYSFNGASALTAGGQATLALVNTHVSACVGAAVWVGLTYISDRKWHLTEVINGGFVGLAGITPGSGFVDPWAAVIIGFVTSIAGYITIRLINMLTDDVLDVSSLQGTPGILGSLLLAVFSNSSVCGTGKDGLIFGGFSKDAWWFLLAQIVGVTVAIVWSALWTTVIMFFMKCFVGIDVKAETEEIGLDLWQIGEQAYDDRLELKLDVGTETLNQKMLEAVAFGDPTEVMRIVDAGADVNHADYDGRTAAHIAASEGRVNLLKMLHARYFLNLNAVDRWSGTPLRDAVRHEHDMVVDWLREQGATMDDQSGSSVYELIQACAQGDLPLVRRLLQAGADPNAGDYDYRTPLMVAASEGRTAVVMLLLERGAQPSLKDRWGKTALESATQHGGPSAKQIASILREASTTGQVGGTQEGDTRIGKKNPKTNSSGHALMMSNGVNMEPVGLKDDGRKSTEVVGALSVTTSTREMCIAASRGAVDEMDRLVKKGAKPQNGDYDYRTPLHLAASAGHMGAVEYILQQSDVNVNAQDRWNNTPLSDAIANSHFEVAEVLRRNGAIMSNGNVATKLCAAAAVGDVETLKKAKAQGVSMNVGDYDMRTPLHLACVENRMNVVEWLLQQTGLVLNVSDRFGNTPFDDAERCGHTNAAAAVQRVMKASGQWDESARPRRSRRRSRSKSPRFLRGPQRNTKSPGRLVMP